MSTTHDNEIEQSVQERASMECKPLLDAATRELFQNNAFRITGLSVDATMGEISKRGARLETMEALGRGEAAHTSAFALKPPPTLAQIREAIQNLKDPEKRIIDAFFWFWPQEVGRSASDPGMQALAAGDGDSAMSIWTAMETSPTHGVVAMHNIAIFWHLTALESETCVSKSTRTNGLRQTIEKSWRNAFKRWQHLTTDRVLWDRVSSLVTQIDDPRITNFVPRIRAVFPKALLKLNAELALNYAKGGEMEFAKMHVQFIREFTEELRAVEELAALVLEPIMVRLREHIRQAKRRTEEHPESANQSARDLLDQTLPLADIFDLFFGKAENAEKELLDTAATTCINCLVAYQKKTDDNRTFVDLLERTLQLAQTAEVRRRIEENIQIGKDNLTFAEFEPVYAPLKTIQDSRLHAKKRFQQLRVDIIPALEALKRKHGNTGQPVKQLSNSVAVVLREISLDAWTNHQDRSTALAAIALAAEFAFDPQLKQKLQEDQSTLAKLPHPIGDAGSEHTRMERGSYNATAYVGIAFAGQIVWTGVLALSFITNILKIPCDDTASWIVGCLSGFGISLLVFWNRWGCIEAFSSRVCCGFANLSIFYVPIIALMYANMRGLKKVFDWREWQDNTTNKSSRVALICSMIVLTFGAIGNSQSSNTLPRRPSNTPTSSSNAHSPAPSVSAVSAIPTYQIPSYINQELDKDKKEIESEREKASALENQLTKAKTAVEAQKAKTDETESRLETLDRQIEADRIYLDRASQSDVDDFNDKVKRYNAMLETARQQNALANQMVDDYNTLLDQVRTETRLLNQMVDNYNAKLTKYGR